MMPRSVSPQNAARTVVAMPALCALLLVATSACPGEQGSTTAGDPTLTTTGSTATSLTGVEPPTGGHTGTSEGDGGAFGGAPRWVLRDRNGVRVQALVEPRCGGRYVSHAKCLPLEFDTQNSFPCVRIVAHEGRYLNLQYEIESGEIEPCNRGDGNTFGYEEPDPSKIPGLAYGNEQCDGILMSNDLLLSDFGPEFTRSRTTLFAAGDVWVFDESCTVSPIWIREPDLSCNGPFNLGPVCPLVPVPAWAKDLLPNPPYTLDAEYGEKP